MFFPDGHTLATASADGRLKLWDWRTKQAVEIGRALNAFHSATLCKDSSRLVAGAGEGWIRIYDSVSHHQLITLKGHNYLVNNVAFLPDDCILASIGGDGVRLWRAPSWEEIATTEAKEKAEVEQP